jgi:anti-sigma regulatory factor (Ser/Thr protein kinase)
MKTDMKLELLINNEQRVLPSVQAFVHQTLAQLLLPDEDAEEIEQFVLRAVVNCIEHAYPAGEEGSIRLVITEEHGKLEIQIRDFGLPHDVQAMETLLQDNDMAGGVLCGCHVSDIVDEVHWLAFGREGKALQLIKWLHTRHITDSVVAEDLAPIRDDVPKASSQEYTIHRMLPAEAVQVSQLMYRTYGSSYFNEDVYYPERVAAQNAHGSVISVVAAGADGRVVGHEAVECNLNGPVAELGQAATDPAHRGRGLMGRIKDQLVREASHLDLVGWYADAVAVHTITQQSNAHHGGHVCGVELGIAPKTEAFRSIAPQQTQRVSCLLYFHWLEQPQVRVVHVPERHRTIVAEIYGNLQCQVEFGNGTSTAQDYGAVKTKRVSGAGASFISVEELGQDSVYMIRLALRELIEISRMEAVFVDLPLADPFTTAVWELLEQAGLGFVGIGPRFSPRGDVVRLVYLVESMVREPIRTYESFAGRLVDYALAEQHRVRANL